MWNFFEKQKVYRKLKKLVTPETLESVLREGVQPVPLKQGRIEYVLVFVRGDNPNQISDRVTRVTELSGNHGVVVHDIIGALVIAGFETLTKPSEHQRSRISLIEDLRREIASEIKIVHGAADGHYGLFGSQGQMSFTFLVPDFDKILGVLSRLKFGEIEEYQSV